MEDTSFTEMMKWVSRKDTDLDFDISRIADRKWIKFKLESALIELKFVFDEKGRLIDSAVNPEGKGE